MPPKRKARRHGSDESDVSDPDSDVGWRPGMKERCVTGERKSARGRRGGRGRGRGRGGSTVPTPVSPTEEELAAQMANQRLGTPNSPGGIQPIETLNEFFKNQDKERIKNFWEQLHEETDGFHRYTYSYLTGRSRRFLTTQEAERDKNFRHFKWNLSFAESTEPTEPTREILTQVYMRETRSTTARTLPSGVEFDSLPLKIMTTVLMIKGMMPPVLPVLTLRQIVILMNILELLHDVKRENLPMAIPGGFKDIVMTWDQALREETGDLRLEYPEEWVSLDVRTVDTLVSQHSYEAVFHVDTPITYIIECWFYELMDRKIEEIKDGKKVMVPIKRKKSPLDIFEKHSIPDWNSGVSTPIEFEQQFDNIMEPLWISNEFIASQEGILNKQHIQEARDLIYKRAQEAGIERIFPTNESRAPTDKFWYPCPIGRFDKEIIRSRYFRTFPEYCKTDPVRIGMKQGFVFYRLENLTKEVERLKQQAETKKRVATLKELVLEQKFIVDFDTAPKHPDEYSPSNSANVEEDRLSRYALGSLEAEDLNGGDKQISTTADCEQLDDPACEDGRRKSDSNFEEEMDHDDSAEHAPPATNEPSIPGDAVANVQMEAVQATAAVGFQDETDQAAAPPVAAKPNTKGRKGRKKKKAKKGAKAADDVETQPAVTYPLPPLVQRVHPEDIDWDDPCKDEEIYYDHIEPTATIDLNEDPPDVELGNPEQNFTAWDIKNLRSDSPVFFAYENTDLSVVPPPLEQKVEPNCLFDSGVKEELFFSRIKKEHISTRIKRELFSQLKQE